MCAAMELLGPTVLSLGNVVDDDTVTNCPSLTMENLNDCNGVKLPVFEGDDDGFLCEMLIIFYYTSR